MIFVKKIPSKSIILWGQSLGSAPSINLAADLKQNIGGIIIQSGFYSALSTRLPDIIVWFFERMDVFNNKGNLSKIKCNCLLVHGVDDGVLPFSHAQKMADILGKSNDKFDKLWLDMSHEWRGIIASQPKFKIRLQDVFDTVLNDL